MMIEPTRRRPVTAAAARLPAAAAGGVGEQRISDNYGDSLASGCSCPATALILMRMLVLCCAHRLV